MGRFECFLRPQSGKAIHLSGETNSEIGYSFGYGGRSIFNTIILSESADREIVNFRRNLQRPVKWNLSIFPISAAGFLAPGIIIRDLWCLGRGRAIGPNKVVYTFLDKRYALHRRMVDSWFNKLRPSNDFNRPSSDKIDSNVVFLSKATKHHFVGNTCKDSSGGAGAINPKFYSGTGPNDGINYQPWTAYQAIRWMLSDQGWLRSVGGLKDIDGTPFSFGTIIYSPRLKERKILLRSWNPRKHWPDAMNELLSLARMGLYVNDKGQFVLEDLEPDNSVFSGYGNYIGAGGVPIEQDLAWDAPAEDGTSISYPTYHEIRWDYDRQFAEALSTSQPDYNTPAIAGASPPKTRLTYKYFTVPKTIFQLENVLPLPQDVPARGWKAGQWTEVYRALRAWFLQAQAAPNSIFAPQNTAYFAGKPELAFTPDAVRRYQITSGLAHLWIRDTKRPNFRNPILEARVASIYQHIDQTFKIPEEWMDQIEDWKVEIGTVFSGVSRTREPSPVRMDYWTVDSSLYMNERNKEDKGTGHLRNIEVDKMQRFSDFKFDPKTLQAFNPLTKKLFNESLNNDFGVSLPRTGSIYDTDFDKLESAPAKAIILDKGRGVFKIDFVPDFTGAVTKYRPGLINPKTMPTNNAGAAPGALFYGFARLLKTFRMAVVLSIKWKSPNHYGRHVKYTPSQVGFAVPPRSFGPPMEIFSRGFEAYKTYKHKAVEWRSRNGYLEVNHKGEIANNDILEEFSRAIYENLYFRFQPRILGEHAAQGWTGQMPIGHVSEVRVSLKPSGALETILNGSRPPAPPSVFEDMSSTTRNLIQRFELGTDLDAE